MACSGKRRGWGVPLFLAVGQMHMGSHVTRGLTGALQYPRLTFAVPTSATGTVIAVSVGDITKWKGDAIVNAANERCLGGGGVDGALHKAAGAGLLEECRKLPEIRPNVRCPTGHAVMTRAHNLPAKWLIHTVGPNLSGRKDVGDAASDDSLLQSAYRSSLELANERSLASVAFPAISCGVFAFPLPRAAQVAMHTAAREAGQLRLVEFVLFSGETYAHFAKAAADLLGPHTDL